MTKLAIVLISLYISIATGLLVDNKYSTCSIQGITHVRGFELQNRVESCYHYGSKILYDSPLVKVSSHTYMNESTMMVDWMSTKVFVEFYGDIYGLPIALFSSDLLMCDCAVPCLANHTEALGLGVDGAIELIVRRESDESYVAYLNYRRVNITLFIRKTTEGFNFGIRVPEYLAMRSSGVCVNGCSRLVDQVAIYECLGDEYIKPAFDICRQAFTGLEQYYASDVNFEKMRLIPCARDVFIWRNASAALAHRHAYIDELLLSQFDTIIRQYNETFMHFEFSWIQYDEVVDQMIRQCEKIPKEDVISVERTGVVGRIGVGVVDNVSSLPVLPLNSTKLPTVDRIAMIDLSGEDTFAPKDKTILPIDLVQADLNETNETVRVDLSSDRFIDISRPEDFVTESLEMSEWRIKCERQRLTKLGIFYLPYPANLTMFVQCDESNRAFLKVCPTGTFFTVKMVCERMVTKSQVAELNETVLPKPTIVAKPKLSELFRGKAPLQIQLVETPLEETMPTTVMPLPEIVNPCTNETRAQKLFFFPYPLDVTKYIQCDDFNKMTIGQCVVGTRFSLESRTCQKL